MPVDHPFDAFRHAEHVNIRIVTTGSAWIFRGDRYLRFPRQEGPRVDEFGRPRPDWGSPDTGQMADGIWHPYIERHYVRDDNVVRLVIEYPDSGCNVPEECSGIHFIRTGPVLEPVVDPATVEMTWWQHEADYLNNRRNSHG